MTGRIVYTPPPIHDCEPGWVKQDPAKWLADNSTEPLAYGSLWRCDQCNQHWEWVETIEWVRCKSPATEKPRWVVWAVVGLVMLSLLVLGVSGVVW